MRYEQPQPNTDLTPLQKVRTKLLAGGLAASIVFGATGCSDSTEAKTTLSTETTTSASPTPTTTPSPTETAPEPTETTPEPKETYEFIEGAEDLDEAMKSLREMPMSELQEIIDRKDVDTLAYYKAVLLLNASEYQSDFIGYPGNCYVEELEEMNPIFYDVRQMSGEKLYCAITFKHIARAQNIYDNGFYDHFYDPVPLDKDLAEKAIRIEKGVLYGLNGKGDTLDSMITEVISEGTTRHVDYNIKDSTESTEIVDMSSTQWSNGKVYETITARFELRDSGKQVYLTSILVPLTRSVDFEGLAYSPLADSPGYGHMRIDKKGNPITKDTGQPLLIPIMIDKKSVG